MPAVSFRMTDTPDTFKRTSTISRVVPASSATIAAGRPARPFNAVDLPAFTGPISAT